MANKKRATEAKVVEKDKVEDEKVVERKETEKEEDFLDEKKSKKDANKKYGEKSTFSKVMNVVLWIILLAWMAVCLFDFYKVHNEQEPFFCIKKGTTKYDDGNVNWCLGLGYKVYDYNRKSFSAIEFGPFWSKDRSALEENK